ncbi:unnamed protein product [Heterobilharzia americana]|nr:unnamed protein product [Heterobilharzia americana]CAH8485197.1 unnamed protein product [Heterobilharzia americana]
MKFSCNCKMLHICFILLVITVTSTVSSHRCYVCSKCEEPFKLKTSEVQNGCSFCSTIRTYIQNRLQVTSRSCVPVCVEGDARRSGSGIVTSCCQDDLCNSSGKIQVPVQLITFSMLSILPLLSILF